MRVVGPAVLALLAALSAAPASADAVRVTLTDGSVLVGELRARANGGYDLRSPSLGTVTLRQADIRRIEMGQGPAPQPAAPQPAAPAAAAAEPPATSQVEALQRRILADDSLAASVLALQDDPQVQAILADPALMEAVRTGDLNALAGDPKLLRLLDSPALRALGERIAPRP